jgi:hypothetical protein
VPPHPAGLAPVESSSSLSAVRRDLLQAPQHHAPMGMPPAPPHAAMTPAAPAPPAPWPRPATLPVDSWKLPPAPTLFPFAVGPAVQRVQAAQAQAVPAPSAAPAQLVVWPPVSAPAAPAPAFAQPPPPAYSAPPSDPGVVVPASLGQNAPRLTLDQYACLAAELAVAPANAAQVRQRYGLDDNAHLAEQGAWQRRFSLDAQLFATYSSLFQHYRDWLIQSARR